MRSIIQAAKSHQIEHLALSLKTELYPKLYEKGEAWTIKTLAYNLSLAAYEFTKYKSKSTLTLKEVAVFELSSSAKRNFQTGLTTAEGANLARDIANTGAHDMTPSQLATTAKKSLKDLPVTVKVLDHKQIKQKKMGLLEAVGKGAADRERFIVMEYWGAGKSSKQKPVILIGKGITYDTGGLNIKPSGYMHEMHMDMTGGATVIGALQTISKLGLKKNVVGLVAAAENAVSAHAMRSGDIATSMSGKTVEILHTDAEGRLVLADALTYAQKQYKPKLLLDIATLTGASLVALGQHASAILTKDESLADKLQLLGEETGDYTWPLLLWDEYKQYLKSHRADLANIATNFSRYGGTIEGGTFLSFFVDKKIPWAHIDIAPRMESISSDKLAKGAAGGTCVSSGRDGERIIMQLIDYNREKVLADLNRLQYLYRLKEVIRYDEERTEIDTSESVAEHVYGMFILTEYFLPLEDPDKQLSKERIFQMILFHDIDEIETGDTLGYRKTEADRAKELAAMKEVLKSAPHHMQELMSERVSEYEAKTTAEAKFAKAIDKIEPLVQIYNEKWKSVLIKNKTTAEESERIKTPYIQDFPYIKQFAKVIHQELINNNYYWTGD